VGSGALILRCYREILELKGRFFGLLVQLIHGVAKLRVAGAEERAFGQWARSYARLARLEYRQRVIRDNVHVANLALSTAGVVCLFALAAALVRTEGAEGGLTIGVFLAFHVAFGTFIGAVAGLSNTITDVMAIAILRERVKPILEQPREVNERKGDPGPLAGAVQVEQVVFRYRTDGPLILDGIRLRAAAGEFVALVGPSGSGKSTLFRLLLGFEDPQSGKILYDGQDLAGLDMQAVRHQMGVVLQEGRINAGSLFENVVCGTQRTLKDAWEAARATGFAQEIEAMPMGMHTMVSEGGTNLSGGQRQRLLLTRALVHKPRLLLLDEATSALDNRTQAIVSRSLADLAVTRLVIAHRLSTVRPADRIYVLESGRIVQQGSFEELARQGGLFSRLMARQMT
jgi:ABC-type bacteriocin/lantibiotic exporter with double-glycine peptidase domain